MLLTNNEILEITHKYYEMLDNYTGYIPAKINFYIQKNKNALVKLAQEIESARETIILEYGVPSEEEGRYSIPVDKIDIVQNELNNLLTITQDVDIKTISLDKFDGIDFTLSQMDTLMFMIEEPEEEDLYSEE